MDTTESPTPEEAEARFRRLVDEADMPQPDGVSYDDGRRELMFRWDSEEIVVVLALDDDEDDRNEYEIPF